MNQKQYTTTQGQPIASGITPPVSIETLASYVLVHAQTHLRYGLHLHPAVALWQVLQLDALGVVGSRQVARLYPSSYQAWRLALGELTEAGGDVQLAVARLVAAEGRSD